MMSGVLGIGQVHAILDMVPQQDLDWIIGTAIVALITAVVGPVITIWVTARLRKDVRVTKRQVTNQHAQNLRDEITEGFMTVNRRLDHLAPVTGAIRVIQDAQENTRKDIGGMREELRIDRRHNQDQLSALRERVHDLEHPEN